MRRFNTIREARDWFRAYTPLANQEPGQGDNSGETATLQIPFWHWILFQYTHSVYNASPPRFEISRPILGLFVGISIWDQAIVVNIVEHKRAWMYSCEIRNNPDPKYAEFYTPVAERDPEVESFQLWTGDITPLGNWQNKPTKAQLREALSKTKTGIHRFHRLSEANEVRLQNIIAHIENAGQESTVTAKLCSFCGKNPALAPHPCESKVELHNDKTYQCNCCEDCIIECRKEI